ncbi:erythromycin esterase family protein [Crossiella sp. CA198]|uniref:erythromycin esterase family protein n=1 Tax=Crossiella sp. CA198 TaxID=3455607 RepID=UPI003F8CFEE4
MSTNISTQARLSDQAVLPLHTLDPAAPLDDLGWLDEVIGDARVVAIGESSHYSTEFPRLRHRVLRYLVQRHGFVAGTEENGFVQGQLVHDWINGGPGAVGTVMADGFGSLTGLWRPVRLQLEWLREHNRTAAEPVRYYGIDLGGSNVTPLPSLDAVLGYLAEADPGYRPDPVLREIALTFAATSAFGIPAAVGGYGALEPERKNTLTAGLAGLLARLAARRIDYTARTGAESYQRAQRALHAAITLDVMVRAMAQGDLETASLSREATLADTVEWVLRREDRIVLGAHNGHVQRVPGAIPGTPPMTGLGVHLADRLGADYRTIGTTSGSGQVLGSGFFAGEFFEELPEPRPGSLDALMAASHDGPFAVNLRTLGEADRQAVRAAGQHRNGTYYNELDPLVAYDALVHVPVVSAGEPDAEALAASPPEVREMFAKWQGSGG